ncbi:hypothetical protein NE236_10370 [Actinoallomurus purpureus]|uniref:hypothetical protein n=1 Tax=Actinoallomurus purpureus TaxID=478114 RepID=UPI002092BBD5|nr:hypothetical protein [Actinoallomurus purpureus]MCO6005388.1 hypothetical protein [Actinoallomurus purpureus]
MERPDEDLSDAFARGLHKYRQQRQAEERIRQQKELKSAAKVMGYFGIGCLALIGLFMLVSMIYFLTSFPPK